MTSEGGNPPEHLYRVSGEWPTSAATGTMFVRARSDEEARRSAERTGLVVHTVYRLGSGQDAEAASPESAG